MESLLSWIKTAKELEYFWAIEIVGIFIFILLFNYSCRLILNKLEIKAKKTKNTWDDALVHALRTPIRFMGWLVGFNLLTLFSTDVLPGYVYQNVVIGNKLFLLLFLMVFLNSFIKKSEDNLTSQKFLSDPVDPTTVKAISKLLRASVLIVVLLTVMQLFDYSVSGLLAFGGIGGIAVGFAAKDLLANFFGGLMIYLDRPFSVGDWIRSPDKEIEGTVEDIGWRLTRIRTFSKRPLYIPNSIFASISVENPSRMSNRRIYETIGIRYDDLKKMKNIVSDVKNMLEAHDQIDNSQTLMVNFNTFSESSVDFFVYTFTKTTDWALFHEIKQDILLKISEIIELNGSEVAFPTSTLYLKSNEKDE